MILRRSAPLLLLLPCASYTVATIDVFGLREQIYKPRCAHSCREAVEVSTLECTSNLTHTTSPSCFATDNSYLQTLAYCVTQRCHEKTDLLEHFWANYVVGWQVTSPVPKYDYETAVHLAGVPTDVVPSGKMLDKVYVVSQSDYDTAYTSLGDWNDAEDYHTRIAIAVLLAGFVVPILVSLLRFLPFSSSRASKYRAILLYPTVWSHQWSVQIRDSDDVSPTRGQGLFILYLLIVNVIFSSVGHFSSTYSFWSFDDRHGQYITCVANRFGALAMANFPLLFLYSGRNNVLLKITNWSHSTFIRLHRWVGYFTIGEAILHSILYLHVAVKERKHTAWSHVPAWQFGIVATLSLSLVAPLSVVFIRRRRYEIFLTLHILLATLATVGIYYHITHLFESRISGWIIYLWCAVIFWASDRLARIARLFFSGVQKAVVTIIDEDHIRVDIPNAKGSGHAYLYFPTLTPRFWENHPFSIATSPGRMIMMGRSNHDSGFSHKSDMLHVPLGLDTRMFSPSSSSSDKSSPGFDIGSKKSLDGKDPGSPLSPASPFTPFSPMFPFPAYFPSNRSPLSPTSTTDLIFPPTKFPPTNPKGLTFFMRSHGGTTALLRKRTSLPVLVEASYGPRKDMSLYPVLICVAGGVGITAILPYLHAHRGTTKLYWGLRSQGLVHALRDEIRGYNGEVIVGKRLFIKLVLQREFARVDAGTPVAVVVSGPRSMGEDVREFCCEAAGNRYGEVRFLDENFSW